MAAKNVKKESEDIPDELPSLAEDFLNEGADSPDKSSKENDIPDELPSLAQDILKGGAPDESAGGEEVPDELPGMTSKDLAVKAGEPGAGKGDDESYFAGVTKRLKKNPRFSGNFLNEMKTFWQGHGEKEEESIREGIKTSFELDLEKEMQQKVKQLEELEVVWKKQKLELERAKKLVENTEIEISLRSEELKKILDTLSELREVYIDIRKKINSRKKPEAQTPNSKKPSHKPVVLARPAAHKRAPKKPAKKQAGKRKKKKL